MRRLMTIMLLTLAAVPLFGQQKNPLRDSLSAAAEALSYHPDSIELRLRKAGWNIMLEQWQYAKDEYDYVLKRNPNNVAALYFRAYANERLGRNQFARLDYQNLLALVPGNFEGRLGLALLDEKDQHYTDAMNGINWLVNQYPDSAVAYAVRSGMEKSRGMIELAEYDMSEALKRDGNNKDYLINHIAMCIRLKKYDVARQELKRLQQLGYNRRSLDEWYQKMK